MKINMKKAVLYCALAIALPIIIIGCTTVNLPDYSPKAFEQYHLYQTKDNLSIAIEPFYDKDKIKKYFGIDLLSHNILPMFVIAENQNPTSSFVLLKEQFSISKCDTKENVNFPYDGSMERVFTSSHTTADVLLISGSILLGFVGAKMHADALAEKYNISAKELQSETISPNKSQNGFVYFRFQNIDDIAACSIANLKALNLQTDEVIRFTFSLK